jgi:3-oxoacyl-[acyl-carrier protein] reductase
VYIEMMANETFHSRVVFPAPHVSVVTGASSGIGAATAVSLAASGSNVVVHYNRDAAGAECIQRLIQERGGRACVVQADLQSRDGAQRIVAQTLDEFGQIDVLVNNAGSMIGRRKLMEVDEQFWREVIDTNTSSALWMTQAAAAAMMRRGSGVVINIASLAARNGGSPGVMAYAASKAAVLCMTKSFAKELISWGIRVNAVSPGVIATPFHERFTTEEQFNALVGAIPQGRAGTAEEIAQVIPFLASPISSHIVGQAIDVNGGLWLN